LKYLLIILNIFCVSKGVEANHKPKVTRNKRLNKRLFNES
jgi:hypothetical protein